jgi:integrase
VAYVTSLANPPAQTPAEQKRPKRANHDGSFYRRKKDGLWIGSILVGTRPDGRPDRRKVAAKTRADAKAKLDEVWKNAQENILPEPNTKQFTVGEYLKLWLEGARGTIRESTWTRYSGIVRINLEPSIGQIKLAKLTPDHLRKLYADKLKAGLAPRTVLKIHVVLNLALAQAVGDRRVARNVASLVKRPRTEKSDIEPPTAEKIGLLLDAAWEAEDPLAPLWSVAAYSGCRKGELLGLKWSDVDFARGTLTLRRGLTAVKNNEPIFSELKTDRSRRVVTLPSDAVDALRQHQARQAEHREKHGVNYAPYGLVFATEIGTPLTSSVVSKRFKTALARVNLPRETRVHDLRHFAATLMLAAGVHPKVASERLGHSTIAITLDLYTHAVEGLDRDAAEKMQEAMAKARKAV